MQRDNEPEMPEISVDKVCFIVVKSRELLSEEEGAREARRVSGRHLSLKRLRN
jgi:hypothetical protein